LNCLPPLLCETIYIEKVQTRIKKIEGQLRAIPEMVDKYISCEDIQINAAKGELHKVGQLVLEGHLQHCGKIQGNSGDGPLSLKTQRSVPWLFCYAFILTNFEYDFG